MHDKVLGIIRETLLHENTFEEIAVRLDGREVLMRFTQPNETSAWPDHELLLTFSGVHEFSASRTGQEVRWQTLLGIECAADGGVYRAEVRVGDEEASAWILRLEFEGLSYRRT
jgi:hypothetical protein